MMPSCLSSELLTWSVIIRLSLRKLSEEATTSPFLGLGRTHGQLYLRLGPRSPETTKEIETHFYCDAAIHSGHWG